MEVVVVINRQQVAMDIGVTEEHIHAGDAVNVLQQLVELLEPTIVGPLEGEAPVLGLILQQKDLMLHIHYVYVMLLSIHYLVIGPLQGHRPLQRIFPLKEPFLAQ